MALQGNPLRTWSGAAQNKKGSGTAAWMEVFANDRWVPVAWTSRKTEPNAIAVLEMGACKSGIELMLLKFDGSTPNQLAAWLDIVHQAARETLDYLGPAGFCETRRSGF